MEQILGFSAFDVLTVAAIVTVFYVALLFPAIYSGAAAVRQQPRLNRPWLFVLTVTSLSYGVLVMAYAAYVPIWAYSIYVAPQLQSSGFPSGASLLHPLSESLALWGPMLIPVLAAIASVPITRAVLRSWRHHGAVSHV